MHVRLADRRVNRVNKRREFFYATPGEAKAHLVALSADLLEYTEVPEAIEFRQSVNEAEAVGERTASPVREVEESYATLLGQTALDAGRSSEDRRAAPTRDQDQLPAEPTGL
jgi:hypothetical protein